MQLEKQVVSLELAKKLSELGVEQRESYFYWIGDEEDKMFLGEAKDTLKTIGDPFNGLEQEPYEYDYSAFTVAELGEMLPVLVYDQSGSYNLNFSIGREGISVEKSREFYVDYIGIEKDIIHMSADSEADARAKMLIHLIENKLINIKQQ